MRAFAPCPAGWVDFIVRSRRWTPEEDAIFRKMAEANTRPEIIAAKLRRSVHAIKARAYIIGLPLKWFKIKANDAPDAPRFVRPR